MEDQKELDFGRPMIAETAEDGSPLWWTTRSLASKSIQIFVKKLSRNDTSWADDRRKHQAGFYIPRTIRETDFFPQLTADNPAKPHIYAASVRVLWPQTGETTVSSMRHYSNKGSETHFTRIPKELFQGLTPASLLLVGKLNRPIADCGWWIVVLDSAGEEAELLETLLDLPVEFHHSVFPATRLELGAEAAKGEQEELIERFRTALRNGTLQELAIELEVIPNPAEIAQQARDSWLRTKGLKTLDPWRISTPGDAIMEISRDVEYRIYRKHELRRRTAELLSILAREKDLASAVVRGYAQIDAALLSASQQRKSRAGRSFEQHIAAALRAGRVRFEEQVVTGGRRPDFVLPNLRALKSRNRAHIDALVLSAKTTLRERWKQVVSERLNCDLFLATVDDRVAAASIQDMANSGICLVVPEALKSSDEAFYKGQSNVISFRDFFDDRIRAKRPFLIDAA